MGLRKKTLIIIVSVFLVLIASVILSSRFLVLEGFIDLETASTKLKAEHVWIEVSNDIPRLASVDCAHRKNRKDWRKGRIFKTN